MATATDAFGNPVVEGGGNQPTPIGVSAGQDFPTRTVVVNQQVPLYVDSEGVVRYGTIQNQTQQPIYTDKRQYYSGNEWQFATSSSDNIAIIQKQLVDAGLLTKYTSGEWDPASASAMSIIMEMSNYSGMTWDQTLARVLASGGFKKVPSTTGGMAAPTMTDEDIRMVANKTAQGVLGRNLREDEISGFVPAFRSMFAGGTSAATAGETVVREQVAPDEAAAYGLGNVMQSIGSLLGGGGR